MLQVSVKMPEEDFPVPLTEKSTFILSIEKIGFFSEPIAIVEFSKLSRMPIVVAV